MTAGSIHWNYQEISLKQINRSILCFFTHHWRELMECFAVKGWGDRQDQQAQKGISTNSWTWDPQSDTPGKKHVHPLQHSQREEHRCREGEDNTSAAALCSALNLPQAKSKCSTTLNLQDVSTTLQASSIQSSAGSLFNILFKKICCDSNFSLETFTFHFKKSKMYLTIN